MPVYVIDPLHPSRLRCELCGRTVAALPDDGEAPPYALTLEQAAHLWPGLARTVRTCPTQAYGSSRHGFTLPLRYPRPLRGPARRGSVSSPGVPTAAP
jgi:hypothetical protein